MNADEKPSAGKLNAPGTEQAPDSAGSEPTLSAVLMQQARAMEAMADTLGQVVAQNQDLMAQLMGDEEEGEEAPHGVDMAGRPIKVSG